ncbi:MAG: AarF/ABC1/UbiB kinase family protein [Spirochaetaceae bacterium]|nr:MAG: AarF/ABC1/UbiB kinase family protein [Spirochaetaceae bacterium]
MSRRQGPLYNAGKMLLNPRHRIHKIARTRQILTRLVFYGFNELTEALGFRRRRLLSSRVTEIAKGRRIRRLPFSARLRLLFEDLGPTFIKLGQLLSLRSDLLPEEITAELRKLQYAAAPLAFSKIEPILQEQWGSQWRGTFGSIDTEPLASASIAQVHRAVTLDGQEVVLKIQRPGIKDLIRSDLSLLSDLAVLIERYLPKARVYKPAQLIDHFAKVLTLELDFNYEGRTMDLVRNNFEHNSGIYIPKVHWNLSSERILVMEYIEGIRLSDDAAITAIDTRRIAEIGAGYVLTQVFEHGVYNADPHPANFIVRKDGVLVPLDFGMVGTLDEEMKQALVNMLMAFVNRDPDKLMRVFYSLELLDETAKRTELSYDLSRLINYYHHIPVAHLSISRMLQDLNAIIRRYRIALPVDLALTLKVVVTVESLGQRLDPKFDVIEVAKPFIEKVRVSRVKDWLDPEKIFELLEDTAKLLRSLPYDVHELLKKARTGKLKLSLDLEDLDPRVREIDRSVNRLSFSVVISGLLVASSFFMRLTTGPRLLGLPILGLAGFAAAGILGIWFLIGILRSGRL